MTIFFACYILLIVDVLKAVIKPSFSAQMKCHFLHHFYYKKINKKQILTMFQAAYRQ